MLQHATLVVLPEQKMAAAVLSSGGSSMTNQLLANKLLLARLKEKGTIKDIKPDRSFGKPVKAKVPQDVVKSRILWKQLQPFQNRNYEEGRTVLPTKPEEKYVYTADGSFINEKGTSKLNFVTEKNGKVYLRESAYELSPGLGQNVLTHYLAQKLENNVLPKKTAAAWAKREGGKFYLVNEKFNSINYLGQQIPLNTQITLKDGYWDGKNYRSEYGDASNSNSRDEWAGYKEAHFYTEDGTEYMEMSSFIRQ